MSITAPEGTGRDSGPPEPTAGQSFVQRLATSADWRSGLVIPVLAVFTAFVIGGLIVMATGVPFTQMIEA